MALHLYAAGAYALLSLGLYAWLFLHLEKESYFIILIL